MISGVANGGAFDPDLTAKINAFSRERDSSATAHRKDAVEPDRSLVAADGDLQPLTAI